MTELKKGRNKKRTRSDDSYRKEEKKQVEVGQGSNTILLPIEHVESCTANQVHSDQNKKPGWRNGEENTNTLQHFYDVVPSPINFEALLNS